MVHFCNKQVWCHLMLSHTNVFQIRLSQLIIVEYTRSVRNNCLFFLFCKNYPIILIVDLTLVYYSFDIYEWRRNGVRGLETTKQHWADRCRQLLRILYCVFGQKYFIGIPLCALYRLIATPRLYSNITELLVV